MIAPRILAALAALMLLAPSPAAARDEVFEALKPGTPLTISPTRAYVLFRTSRKTGINWSKPVFMRLPRDGDFGEDNVQDISGKPYQSVGDTDFYLVALPPGEYVFFGMGVNHYLITCNCLGTVGFKAAQGRVTDIGTLLFDVADKPSNISELAGETGLGASVNGSGTLTVAAIRPAGAQALAMPGLDPARVEPADFVAIGPYPNPGAAYINRLAPIAGVLAYDKDGRVLDVKRNVEAMPH